MCQQSCQVIEEGPIAASYQNGGCSELCTFPPNSHLTGLAPVGMGDACPWQCNFAYYMDVAEILDPVEQENETSYVCLPCDPSACIPGLEEYHPALCLPQSNRSAFCLPCPQASSLSKLVAGGAVGQCQYECLPGVSYQSSVDRQCKPCPSPEVYCPAGFKRICAENPCVVCPAALLLAPGILSMPSNSDACQISCRDGYHTIQAGRVLLPPLASSYNATSVTCASCSLRPSIPCPIMHSCPLGYVFVAASGVCRKCATVYDCGLGMFASSCMCVQCPPIRNSSVVPILQAQADALLVTAGPSAKTGVVIAGWGTCPLVCAPPHYGQGGCVLCSSFNTPGFNYFAMWNASNGTRWWPADQDPPHLPPRSTLSAERRAGLCWPCPAGYETLAQDPDLCLSPLQVPRTGQVFAPRILSQQQLVSLPLPHPNAKALAVRGRRLLSHGAGAMMMCPAFATHNDQTRACECNPGFHWDARRCIMSRPSSFCKEFSLLEVHPNGRSLRFKEGSASSRKQCPEGKVRDAHGHCRRAQHSHRRVDVGHDAGCDPGQEQESLGVCKPCARGTYSGHKGFSPCMKCPSAGTTTKAEGSIAAAQCAVPLQADQTFVSVS